MNTFTLKSINADGSATFTAPHELHNEVTITFPRGYWPTLEVPQEVDIELIIHEAK